MVCREFTTVECTRTCEQCVIRNRKNIHDKAVRGVCKTLNSQYLCILEKQEYLIVHYAGFDWDDESDIGMMRNSHVDMFRI